MYLPVAQNQLAIVYQNLQLMGFPKYSPFEGLI